MFVQATKSKRKGKTYVTYLVRESFRTADGPRSRTVCNITDLPPALRDLIAAGLRGQNLLPADQAHLEAALDYGGLAVLKDAWFRYRLDELFQEYSRQFAPLLSAASRVRYLLSLPPLAQSVVFELFRFPGLLPFVIRKTRRAG